MFQDLQESEVCQDELALRVKQLKAELVLFKGLVSNVSLLLTQEKCLKLMKDSEMKKNLDSTVVLNFSLLIFFHPFKPYFRSFH